MNYRLLILTFLLFLLAGCERPSPAAQIVVVNPPAIAGADETATPASLPSATPGPTETAVSPTPIATLTPTPFYTGPLSAQCGQILPILPVNNLPTTTNLSPNAEALNDLLTIMPENTQAALDRILAAPETVGLVAFRVGNEANGVYLNPDMQMPLASVAKVITLVAYSEAVANGEIDPTSIVPLETLEHYYLPRTDLGTHQRAIRELDENGKLLTNPDAVLLDEVPWMMVRHSSNAAADYLHLLLGQERVEETAVSLNLTSQTAPCTFLGQFLAMGNHTRSASQNQAAINNYIANPATYGAEAALLADAYSSDANFRQTEQNARSGRRGPSINVQRTFAHELNAQGSPIDYANLIALIAQNGLTNSESSFLTRRYLEWPMQFPSNQALFSNIGYKNGSLPGILTTVYYAYPLGETTPVVIVLFYKELPNNTYRQWRTTLPHDEFARWMLANPAAIPALKAVINP